MEFKTFLDTFISPRDAFNVLKEKNYFIIALIFTLLVSTFSAFIFTRHINYKEVKIKMMERMEKAGRPITEEEADSMLEKQANFGKKFGHFFALFTSLIVLLFLAFIFYLIFKLTGADFSYKASFSTTVHGFLPSTASSLLGSLILLKKGMVTYEEAGNLLYSHLGFLVEPEKSPQLYSLLSSLDFFSLWSLGLLVYGFSVISGKKIKTSAGVIMSLWILYILIKILFAGFRR